MSKNNRCENKPQYLEYTSAAVPKGELLPQLLMPNENNCITTPNLLARYFTFNKNNTLDHNFESASSHVFYVFSGSGKTTLKLMNKDIVWKKGDVFIIPYCKGNTIHEAFEDDTILFTVDDSPLLEFLKSKPYISRFHIVHYPYEDIMSAIEKFNSEPYAELRNRNGVILSNDQMIEENLNTITHTMWSLLNSIAPNSVQGAHRHNSIAIDVCVDVDESPENEGKVYTLMGKKLNEKKEIIEPIKMVWKKGYTFTTPPGWWHSHHNESDKPAWVFPVQDAGLHTHMHTLNIQFA